jgi:phenylacetate-CoA ligase
MRKEFKDIYKIKDDVKWSYNSSGGSTGEPVKFIQDFDYAAHSDAMARLQYEWAGCKLGDLIIKLWGSEKDITKEKQSVRHIFANWVKSVYLLNSFLMDENKMKAYVDIINKKRPKLILAYAQSIYELAKFIEKNKLKVFAPGAIMTSAGTLYPSFRNTIESVFKCHVFNRYGSREVGAVACECEEHKGLHISIFTHYVEILNKYLQPCKEGETGRVYVTLLTNFTMPLIRYEIGDMAVFTQKKCSCKRGLPVLKDVVGRETDVFKTKDGRIIPGEFFIHFIGVVHNQGFISKFQVIQKDYDLIQIKLVLSSKQLFDKSKGKIEESIKKVMGEKCKIEFKIVKDIKSTKSGKYRYTTREF